MYVNKGRIGCLDITSDYRLYLLGKDDIDKTKAIYIYIPLCNSR